MNIRDEKEEEVTTGRDEKEEEATTGKDEKEEEATTGEEQIGAGQELLIGA